MVILIGIDIYKNKKIVLNSNGFVNVYINN